MRVLGFGYCTYDFGELEARDSIFMARVRSQSLWRGLEDSSSVVQPEVVEAVCMMLSSGVCWWVRGIRCISTPQQVVMRIMYGLHQMSTSYPDIKCDHIGAGPALSRLQESDTNITTPVSGLTFRTTVTEAFALLSAAKRARRRARGEVRLHVSSWQHAVCID